MIKLLWKLALALLSGSRSSGFRESWVVRVCSRGSRGICDLRLISRRC